MKKKDERTSAPLAIIQDGRPRWLPIGGLGDGEYREEPELEEIWKAKNTMRQSIPESYRNQIVVSDALAYLQTLPAESVPLFLFSPPYNLGSAPWPHLGNWKQGDSAGGRSKWKNGSDAANGIQYSEHKDAMPWQEYIESQRATLRECWRCLPNNGAIFYNHKPRVIGARLWTPLELIPDDVIVRQIVVWARAGGLNYNPTAFVPTHEWILIIAKPDFRLKSKGASGAGDVWTIPQVSNTWHPAPFPIKLAERVIETVMPALVCDP